MRPLWRIGGSVLVVAMLAFGTLQAISRIAHRTETVVTVFDQPGLRLIDLSIDQGSVRVVGTDRDAVTVTVRVSHGLVATQRSEVVDGDRLIIDSSCNPIVSQFCRTDYLIEAPSDIAVTASTSHNDMSVSNITGPVELSTSHGNIEVDRVSGAAQLSTSHGNVIGIGVASSEVTARSSHGDVRLGFNSAPSEIVATTSHGNIEIVLPDTGVAYAVDLSTSRGSTSSPVRTDPIAERTIEARSSHGDVTVRYP